MTKRIICLVLVLAMITSMLALSSCSESDVMPDEGTVTRMTVDINPSVEFMVDDENKIVSVTALNDDGSILIVGETFIGKTPEEAVELMVTLATDTGYLVEGNAQISENTVKISVSGDTEYAEKLLSDVEAKASEVLRALDINGTVEAIDALNTEALRTLAESTTLYTKEEIAAMTENEINAAIAESRIETALLLTEEMRDAYYSIREYEISFAESEAVADIIGSLGGIYTITHTAYKSALDAYSAAITELENLRYELLISPESEYQKSLLKLRDAKVELLQQRNYTASLEIDGEEYASATATLALTEDNYNKALAVYEELGRQANEAMDTIITALKQAEVQLKELEKTLFDENIEAKLLEKASEIEASVNAAKDSFFAEFEEEHASDLTAIENELLAKKEELKKEKN